MKVFVSYRRKTWAFTHRLADALRQRINGEVFIDFDSIDESDFANSILVNLRKSDVFVLVVSEHTFALDRIHHEDDWVRREIREALALDMPIVLALVEGQTPPSQADLPADIQPITRRQGVEFYPRYFDAGVNELVRFIERVLPPGIVGQHDKRQRRSVKSLAWAGGMGLGAVAITLMVLLLTGVLRLEDEKSAADSTSNDLPEAAASPTEEATQPVAESTPDSPTLTPTILPTPSPDPDLAFNGVSSNAEWQPQVKIIGGVEMALVPAGCFMMGSEDGASDEWPVHDQCFDQPFWIDVYEVSNAQYGSLAENCLDRSSSGRQPRICLTWFDAAAYCESRGARLPTEAEWEYAARGPDGLVYPWGNDFVEENVVSEVTSEGKTVDVRSKPEGVSWVGAYHMSGNVWEWTNTIHANYPYDATDGREAEGDEELSQRRVLRGGAWGSSRGFVRAANRGLNLSTEATHEDGFRCARQG